MKRTAERGRATPLFIITLTVLGVSAAICTWWLMRSPAVGVDDTVRAFLEAARAQRFDEARTYCTPDLARDAIRSWMSGGFDYHLNEVECPTPYTADEEVDITKGAQKFIIRFSLYNGDNHWKINAMMVTR